MLRLAIEGVGHATIARYFGTAKSTVARLMTQTGIACAYLHDAMIHGITASRIECDETWSFVQTRKRRPRALADGRGPVWTWLAVDTTTKLIVQTHVGARTRDAGDAFFGRLMMRIQGGSEIVTDGHAVYPQLVRDHPLFSHRAITDRAQTNIVENINALIRQRLRRYARRASGFSKSPDEHRRALAFFVTWYNLCHARRIRSRLVTPAMAAGLTHERWTMEDIDRATMALWGITRAPMRWPARDVPSIAQRAIVVAPPREWEGPTRERADHVA